MTVVAFVLAVCGMGAALARHRRAPLHALSALGMGAIMVAVLAAPTFSRLAASTITLALLLPLAAAALALRARSGRHPHPGLRTAVAVSIVDIGFMATTVLVMPSHLAVRPAPALGLPATMIGHGPATSGWWVIWVVLLTWAGCAAALLVPAVRARAPGWLLDVVCSGSMIAAMAAMAA
ncbi:hypothetical protein [Lacisediminihabitans profunda]|uniref:Uncharacterized protein n=1 Tax=Lacisediminihabitans profunda TaxID=2594790 RepID=A0A5C8USL1_9MICO|nr:hypothetical protein [Lacisediminihabitans profunda]TXN31247.1 hypothetical protein FVP33_06660 [Lacisediminihabitans profunda]